MIPQALDILNSIRAQQGFRVDIRSYIYHEERRFSPFSPSFNMRFPLISDGTADGARHLQ